MENKNNGEISIEELPSMLVASCFTTSRSPETEVIKYMESWIKSHGLDYSKLRKFGFDIPVSEEQRKYGLRSYEFWVSVPDDIENTEGVKIRYINSSKYAKLRIKNPFVEPEVVIPAGWKMLLDWVMAHKEKKSDDEEKEEDEEKYMLEEIVETKDGTCIDLYFPIK